jgi:hypothetical protein
MVLLKACHGRLNVAVVAKFSEQAADHFGWFALFAEMDVPASSERTRALLGWAPKQPGLIADIDQPSYFEGYEQIRQPILNGPLSCGAFARSYAGT